MSGGGVKEWSRDGYSDERSGDFYSYHDEWSGLVACLDGVTCLYDIPDKCNAIRVCVRKCPQRPSGAYKVRPSKRNGFACVEDPYGNQIVCPDWIHWIWVSVDRASLWVWVEIDA